MIQRSLSCCHAIHSTSRLLYRAKDMSTASINETEFLNQVQIHLASSLFLPCAQIVRCDCHVKRPVA